MITLHCGQVEQITSAETEVSGSMSVIGRLISASKGLSPWLTQSYLTIVSRVIVSKPAMLGSLCHDDMDRQHRLLGLCLAAST